MLQVAEAFEVLERGRRGGAEGEDFGAAGGVGLGVAGEVEEDVCQHDGGGVVCGHEDVEELVADVVPVLSRLGELVREHVSGGVFVAFLLLRHGGVSRRGQLLEDFVYSATDELAHGGAGCPESRVASEDVPEGQLHPLADAHQGELGRGEKGLCLGARIGREGVDRLAEEQLRRGVKNEL